MAAGQGLDKLTLISSIKAMARELRRIEDEEEAYEAYANKLADIIETYVKSGKVITVGSATTQQGMIT